MSENTMSAVIVGLALAMAIAAIIHRRHQPVLSRGRYCQATDRICEIPDACDKAGCPHTTPPAP